MLRDMLSKIIQWLSLRFPEQLVVSKQEYKELREELSQVNLYVQGIVELNTRLVALEARVKELSISQGFVNTAKGSFKLER